ncbi:MipA/OmpV family protein [Shewanella sp. JM162201]|uniref:MipA/OmpV family protein n=1 Tax=Shewanella jiangmenensis TaxID=2837387 RepID=A0ABS5V1E0_9GAMM|nr:MipA/OmpV family protein [Shewanella jiangmenensis]MBT1444291.1 MipA/OmpV family protein [Shewanella jiangmenensis]
MKRLFTLLLLLCTSVSALAEATQDAADSDTLQQVSAGDWQFSLALGYGVLENPRAKTDNISTYVLPSWYYYGERFYVENLTLGYSLYETDWISVDVQGQPNEDGIFFEFDGVGKLLLSDIMGFTPSREPITRPSKAVEPPPAVERKISYLAGLSATWYTPAFDLTSGLFYDVTGVHNGYEWQLSAKKAFVWSWGAIGLEAGGVYKSAELVDYYYNARKEEFTRPIRLKPLEAATNWHVKAVVNVPLSDSLMLVATLKHTALGDSIRDSVLISADSYFAGFVGVSYQF